MDKWRLAPIGLGPYQHPCLAKGLFCIGIVHGHPNFEDGEEIQTSEVFEFDEVAGTMRTRNRSYSIGTVCPKYLRWRTRRSDGEPLQPLQYSKINQSEPSAKRAG